jgi:2-iminobutanoate/2-iminopropanoate deaminase
MTKSAIVSPKLAPPVGPFSQAMQCNGLIYLSGQVGQDPNTGKLVEGGVAAEAEQVFKNVSAVLEAAGKSFADVVQVRVFLTNIGDYPVINAIYAKQFSAPYPARTAVGVAALPLGASFEIDLVAAA